jgi:hypothetical protein
VPLAAIADISANPGEYFLANENNTPEFYQKPYSSFT